MRRAVVLLLLALTASGCASTGGGEVARGDVGERKLRITTTVNFLTDTVQRIGGDRVEVTGLMGPGVDPHLFKASADDVAALREADVIFYGGLELEGRMSDLLDELAERQPTVAVTRDIPEDRLLVEAGTRATPDPHVWFDPELWLVAARTVAEELARLDPAHRADYFQRLRTFTRAVEHVAEEAAIALERIPRRSRVLVTSHDAFAYFGRAFDLDVVPIQGISTAAEATTADIKRVARVVAERDVKAVFVESSVPRQTIDAVIEAVRAQGGEVRLGGELYGDAAGQPGTPDASYAGMLQANVRRIAEGLR